MFEDLTGDLERSRIFGFRDVGVLWAEHDQPGHGVVGDVCATRRCHVDPVGLPGPALGFESPGDLAVDFVFVAGEQACCVVSDRSGAFDGVGRSCAQWGV